MAGSQPPTPRPEASAETQRGVTLRAVLVGAVLCAALTAGEPFGVLVVHGSPLCADFSTGGAIFLFFVLVFAFNALLRRLGPRVGLSTRELVTVYVMLVLASAIPSWGFTMNMMGLSGGLRYFASPENRWAELILPHVKNWITPTDDLALRHFFQGLPPGEPLPWRAWVAPLVWWSTFILAVYLVMVCVVALLRRQWVEHERLTFPLAQLPLEMASTDSPRAAWPALFRSRMMWVGFAIPFLVLSYNGIQKYAPSMPPIQLTNTWLHIIPGVLYSNFAIRFEVIGLSYLVNTDVLLGLWVFAWYFMIQKAVFLKTGFSIGPVELYSDPGTPTEAYEAFGAVAAYVLIGLWVARRHLRSVFRKAVLNAPDVDDSRELLSYRGALLGLVLGLVYVVAWMTRSGMAIGHACLFVAGALVAFLGLTKIICEAGLAYARTPVTPSALTHSILGPAGLGPASVVNLGLALTWSGDTRTAVMTSAATGAKMGDAVGASGRRLFGAMLLALVVGLASSIVAVLLIGYAHGGMNLGSWQFGSMTRATGTWITQHMQIPEGTSGGTSWWKMAFLGIGAAFMSLLMMCRYRFPWWPIHPAGLAVGLTHPTFHVWFSIFVAWLIKVIVLKLGGISLYRRTRPLFLGMILGAFTAAGVWLVIDWLAGMQGSVFTLG